MDIDEDLSFSNLAQAQVEIQRLKSDNTKLKNKLIEMFQGVKEEREYMQSDYDALKQSKEEETKRAEGLEQKLIQVVNIIKKERIEHQKKLADASANSGNQSQEVQKYVRLTEKLQKQCDDVNAQLQDQINIYNDVFDKYSQSQEVIATYKQKAEDAESLRKQEVQKFHQLENQFQILQGKTEKIIAAYRDVKSKYDELLQKNNTQPVDNKALENKIRNEEQMKANEQLQNLKNQLTEMKRSNEAEIQLLTSKLAQNDETIKKINADKENYYNQLMQERSRQNSSNEERVKVLTSNLSKSESDLKEAHDQLRQIESENSNLKSTVTSLEKQVSNLKGDIFEQKQRYEDNISSLDASKSEFDSLKQQLDQEKQRTKKAQADYDKVSDELQRFRDKIKEIATAYQSEKDKRQRAEQSSSSATQKISDLTQELRMASQEKDTLQKQIERLSNKPAASGETDALKSKIRDLERQLRTAEARVKEAEAKASQSPPTQGLPATSIPSAPLPSATGGGLPTAPLPSATGGGLPSATLPAPQGGGLPPLGGPGLPPPPAPVKTGPPKIIIKKSGQSSQLKTDNTSSGPSQSDLIAQIKQGVKLKKTEGPKSAEEKAKERKNNTSDGSVFSLGNLVSELAKKRQERVATKTKRTGSSYRKSIRLTSVMEDIGLDLN